MNKPDYTKIKTQILKVVYKRLCKQMSKYRTWHAMPQTDMGQMRGIYSELVQRGKQNSALKIERKVRR